MAMSQAHKDAISKAMKRRAAEKRNGSLPGQIEEKYVPPKKGVNISLPSNPHRIQRVVELGTMMDEMFPKTKLSQIREILHSVKRIVERGA